MRPRRNFAADFLCPFNVFWIEPVASMRPRRNFAADWEGRNERDALMRSGSMTPRRNFAGDSVSPWGTSLMLQQLQCGRGDISPRIPDRASKPYWPLRLQ